MNTQEQQQKEANCFKLIQSIWVRNPTDFDMEEKKKSLAKVTRKLNFDEFYEDGNDEEVYQVYDTTMDKWPVLMLSDEIF